MFRRRKNSPHHQPLSASSSQSAQSAATHAFLKSQPSSSSLSSAAAATALRSLSPTPQPVENVQTKRMVQRRASVASPMSLRPTSRNGLRRVNSSSSMTARTFREPSPCRPSTSSGPSVQARPPPLPSIPPEYASPKTDGRRSSSLEPPARPSSPPKRALVRGASVDATTRPSTIHSHGNRVSSLSTVPELERAGSRGSINFSYPRGARPNSPNSPSSPIPYDTRDRRSPPGISNIQRTKSRGSASGGAAIAAAQAAVVHKVEPTPSVVSRPAVSRDPYDQRPPLPRPVPKEPPHTVPVDRQGEDRPEPEDPVPKVDEKPTGSRSPIERPVTPVEQTGSIQKSARVEESPPGKITSETDEEHELPSKQAIVSPEPVRSTVIQPEAPPAHLRQSSCSPSGRSARFSDRLSVAGTGDHLHRPPPRSVSPVKSAMKHSNSPKGSLSPERRVGMTLRPGPALSEISDGTSVASDEGCRLGVRKKTARVSFDDEAEIVGVAASPPTSLDDVIPDSPQGKSKVKSWFGIGKRKSHTSGRDEFDEVMKPRPALPSFGSIRGGREPAQQGPIIEEASDNESTDSSDSGMFVQGWSNDHAIGGILRKPKTEEVEKRDSPDHPLPTTAQSADGVLSFAEKLRQNPPVDQTSPTPQADNTPTPALDATADSNLSVPAIAVQPATPEIEKERSSLEWYDVPGGFPRSSLEHNPKASGKGKGKKLDGKAASGIDAEDEPRILASGEDHSDGESDESVYSDAAEDIEGDGFGSINAIVDSRRAANLDRDGTLHDHTETAAKDITPATQDPSQNARAVPSADGTSTQRTSNQSNTTAKRAERPTSLAEPVQLVTLRGNQGRKKRPLSLGPIFHKGKDAGAGDEVHVNGKGTNGLRRQTSSGSDSSSSFKRVNRSPRRETFSMRQTMRGSPQSSGAQSPSRSPASPTDHRLISTGSPSSPSMRTSLRGSGLQNGQNGKASFFSTGKRPKPRITKTPGTLLFSSSRFGDSDDEDGDNQPRGPFRSRFVDSSDEDGQPASNSLRPVRGIPRRRDTHDGDSTELEDSSDNESRHVRPSTPQKKRIEPPPPETSPLAAVAKSRGVSEQELEEFLRQPARGRVSNFFSRLSIKKSKDSDRRIRKSLMESPSRRDTPLERTRFEREQIREEPALGVVTTVTSDTNDVGSSPKVLRRNSKRSGAWPLGQDGVRTDTVESTTTQANGVPIADDQSQQPVPAGDTTGNGDDTPGESSSSPQPLGVNGDGDELGKGDNPTAMDVVIEGSGRKKRFPMLRKALRLRT